MTGIALIAQERAEQITKHGYTRDNDKLHTNGQLAEAAIYAINGDYETYPKDWNPDFKDKIGGLGKTYIQRLAVAGALIAAEIDRMQNIN